MDYSNRKFGNFYWVWHNMKQRCLNKNNPSYKNYGGRGIIFCDRWLKFANFKDDMFEEYAYGLEELIEAGLYNKRNVNFTLDRIDNNGSYCKENCRWTNQKEQCRNRKQWNERLYTLNGETLNILSWSQKSGIKYGTLLQRLKNGWSFKNAVTIDASYKNRYLKLDNNISTLQKV